MTLADNVHQLVNEHLKMGPDGKPRMVPSLLSELREAVMPGHAGSAGGSDGGPPIPINPNAVDLLAKMKKGAKDDYWEMLACNWPGELDGLLIVIAQTAPTHEWQVYFEHVTMDWIDEITKMLWPVKPRRKLFGKTCPACSQSLHGEERAVCLSLGCWDDNGELAKIGDWHISCEACDAAWSGDEVSWLLRAFDTPEPKVALPS